VFGLRPAFPGGITLPPRDPDPGELAIRQLPFAAMLYLPLGQRSGGAAAAVVREGEAVVRGQLLARAGGEDGAALHSPATGTVQRISEQPGPYGEAVQVIQLAPFPGDTQEYPGGPGLDPETASAERLVEAIREAGIVGMGGEVIPTHVRLRRPSGENVGTVVLNGIEVEHVFSRVPAVLREHADDVLLGVRCLLKATSATRAVLAVEPRDESLARALVSAAPAGMPLELRVLPPRYPQGAEALLGRVLSQQRGERGNAPVAGEARCFNLATVAEIGRSLAQGRSVTDQVITLVGGALAGPGNYRVPLGTPVGFVLAHAGLRPDAACVLQGGPMRGEALASLDVPVTKGMTGLVALDREEAATLEPPLPCIRCGECVAVCPLQLHPAQLGLLARKNEFKAMHEEYNLEHCFECGCCAYVCPSHIPLVQLFRAAKAQWRRRRPVPAAEVGT
jgi:Na+-translocating ferredoxin:NAD+ oxidoreductase subunit C